MNPVIYAVVDPTATDPKDRVMPVRGTDNGDGTCSVNTTGGGGGGGDATAANQVLQLAQETATKTAVVDTSFALGAFDDNAAIADTSDGGLISLFKRHLQRWTTFFTLLPASLGPKADTASLAVTMSTQDVATQSAISTNTGNTNTSVSNMSAKLPATLEVSRLAVRVAAKAPTAWTNVSGSITAGGTSQVLMAANSAREGFEFVNVSSGDLWIVDSAAAASATISQPSILVKSGGWYYMALNGVSPNAFQVIGATTGQQYSARQW